MKIHLDGRGMDLGSSSGPNSFAIRLARRVLESGHEFWLDGPTADISLVFIEPSGRPLAKKVVQRLDGIWFKPDEFLTKNVGIKGLYERADAVIWQSDFDRQMTTKWWGTPRRGEVIRNGIELNPLKELSIPRLVEMQHEYKRIFVCSANWHPQKRLNANLQLFEKLRQKESSCCLIVLGANPDVRATGPHIYYAGSVGPEVYNQIYAAANWMFHLAWADHCPNVVVEALAQGTPVVCSDVGGTKELIGNYGIVLKDDPYDFELADYDNPPALDLSQIDDLPSRESLDYSSIADININNVTDRYLGLFASLM